MIDFWNQAHIKLRSINSELAMRCLTKAEYRTEPDKWDKIKVEKFNITFNSMNKSLREFE